MTASVGSQHELPHEASIPMASLESILCTEELLSRPRRPPDYEKENRALTALASALVDPKANVLQILAETILDVTQCDSSGLSLLTKDGKKFYWPAIAGMWKPHIGGGTPRDFGPCGDVLDRNRTLLFRHFERRYPYLTPVIPAAEECLLVPFYVGGKAVGTFWGIMHSDRRKFDAEDERLMNTLGHFASLAYQTVESIDELKLQIAEREKAEAAARELASGLQAKIRRLVDANIIGIFIFDLENRIIEANDAFLQMVGYDREDFVSGRVRWTDLTPPEWRDRHARARAELKMTGTVQPYEREYFRKDGSRVPALIGSARIEESGNEVVAFVLDLTERKRAAEALREVQMELAHANRVATMGQLTASIAHEVRQPITATEVNARTALRWLSARPPELEEARQALDRIVRDSGRADAVIDRIRALVKRAPQRQDRLAINEVILEVVALTRSEAAKNGVSVRTGLADTLPLIRGDRIQVQQVILNLIINAIEAMSGISEGARELLITSGQAEPDGVLVAVRDSGPGLAPDSLEHVFDAFYTTKPGGLGLGLSICRSIIDTHGGRLWVSANVPRGAIFHFTMPAHPDNAS
jgi:PAS domain S-box-containing protein